MGFAQRLAIIPNLSPEMGYLALSVILLLVHLSVQSFTFKAQVGNRYTMGARDEGLVASGAAGRAERAFHNFLETFPAFAALAIAIEITGKGDPWSAFAAALYFWMRLLYLPVYLGGVVRLRSLIWDASAVGIVILVWRLLA